MFLSFLFPKSIQYFLKLKTFIERLDGIIDSSNEYPAEYLSKDIVDSEISPFFKKLLTRELEEDFEKIVKKTKQKREDLILVGNIFSYQVCSILTLTEEFRKSRSLEIRKKIAEKNIELGSLVLTLGTIPSNEVAAIVNTSNIVHYKELIPFLFIELPDFVDLGNAQKLNDIRDIFSDIRTEVEFEHITPNYILYRAEKEGLDFNYLYHEQFHDEFKNKKNIHFKSLPKVLKEIITEERHGLSEMIKTYNMQFRMVGFGQYLKEINSYPTWHTDHKLFMR